MNSSKSSIGDYPRPTFKMLEIATICGSDMMLNTFGYESAKAIIEQESAQGLLDIMKHYKTFPESEQNKA